MNLTQRLIVGSLLVCGVFVVLTVGSLDWRLRNRLRDATSTELIREARLVGAQWVAGLDPDSLADAAGAALTHRVTLVTTDGRVVGDSEFDEPALSRLENHAARPEIGSAMRADTGSSVRQSPSAGDEEMAAMTRDLIDSALQVGGRYYLPYRLHATVGQFRRAYPMADKFFALKRKYDPDEIFQNEFYRKYGAASDK